MPPLSILIWLPAACGPLAALLSTRSSRAAEASDPPADARRWSAPAILALAGALAVLGLAIAYIADYTPSGGLQDVTDIVWISELGIHYKLGVDGLNVFLVGLTAVLFAAATLAANLRSWQPP